MRAVEAELHHECHPEEAGRAQRRPATEGSRSGRRVARKRKTSVAVTSGAAWQVTDVFRQSAVEPGSFGRVLQQSCRTLPQDDTAPIDLWNSPFSRDATRKAFIVRVVCDSMMVVLCASGCGDAKCRVDRLPSRSRKLSALPWW